MTDYSDSVTPSCPLRSPSLPDYPSPWLPNSQANSSPSYTPLPGYPNNPPSTSS